MPCAVTSNRRLTTPRPHHHRNASSSLPARRTSPPQSSMADALDSTPYNRPPQSDTMPLPASRPLLEKVKETSPIKTQRPDISMDTKETALISALSALSSQNLNHTEARRFLEKLEDIMVPSERGGPAEPLLVA